MKIAILGTRGIPNNYGGFEQLAQHLSLGLREKGHEVYVYSSHRHSFKERTWRGINIIHKYDPEKKIGTMGQFIYDLNSIMHSRRHGFDVIINLGYTSSSVWMKLFPKKSLVITNMDGLEWKRSKYGRKVQRFLRYAEKLAVKYSDMLVADSIAIQKYLLERHGVHSHYIAYGADIFQHPDPGALKQFGLEPYSYDMLIARMEPENNIEMILEGVTASGTGRRFLVVGNYKNKFGSYLRTKFAGRENIVFTGPIYDAPTTNNLRYYSNLYFHGHSVGGTNPSLLEAMGCNCLISAHDNEFNRGVLGDDAYYFSSAQDISRYLRECNKQDSRNAVLLKNNLDKISGIYTWDRIVHEYEALMKA
jgi:glycosyltransferase involved in cell wall biosynthesis